MEEEEKDRELQQYLIKKLNEEGQTIILITHDNGIAQKAKKIVRISDGKLYDEEAIENG